MKQIIIDTSFIITCVRQKIDFFEKLEHEGIKPLVPLQALQELSGLGADTALKVLEKNDFEVVAVKGKDADSAIIKIARKNPNMIVATLDQGLQKKLKNRKMIIRGKKSLEIV